MSPNRLVRAGDLVVQSDIVERLALNPTKVANLASGRQKHLSFPRPIHGRGKTGIWLWSEIETWFNTEYQEYIQTRQPPPGVSRQRDPRPACKGRRR